ncbi:MBOAT family O-acyltransferase [Anaerosporobacter faecicola]|uniref:MBOAT family O-acyltransferase n=1 Tax=Anaerosporobacter faecicola TaxID=2718714 RepID=UPI0014387BAA|nr:MBOAT family protein [Anaerosporobacter faecicola]
MVFSSILFLFRFLPLVLLAYYIVPRAYRNFLLFIMSLAFYAWGEPVYILLMLFSTIVDYVNGGFVDYYLTKGKKQIAKIFVILSVVINLGLLGFFKYTNLVIDIWNKTMQGNVTPLSLALPIGISFYTFQTMSYTIDIYRGEAKAQKNIIAFGTYVSLFPQLIAGPIVQYKQISDQLTSRKETFQQFSYGIHRFVIGLGKKVLLANTTGAVWEQIKGMNMEQMPILTGWLGILMFAFQIYFDFSGYSDMAIGLGHMFGFHFLENFNYPYRSKSITEFWRRWHISLSSWFRDYVYIPLGGSRQGLGKQIRNILIVWLLTGIWHGASLNFLFWGLYFALLLTVEKVWLLNALKKLPGWFNHVYAMFFILIGWVIFAFEQFVEGKTYLQVLFGRMGTRLWNKETIYLLYNHGFLLIIAILASTGCISTWINKRWNEEKLGFVLVKNGFYVLLLFLSIAYLVDASYNPFLYFRF